MENKYRIQTLGMIICCRSPPTYCDTRLGSKVYGSDFTPNSGLKVNLIAIIIAIGTMNNVTSHTHKCCLQCMHATSLIGFMIHCVLLSSYNSGLS